MSHLAHAAKGGPRDSHPALAHAANPRRDWPTDVVVAADRYKSANREIKAGCDLFRIGDKGEAIYSLVDGWVALYNLVEDGRRQILEFVPPGAVLAFVPTRGAAVSYSAQALTDAVVHTVPHDKLGLLFREFPDAGMQLAGLIARDRSLAYDHLSSIGRGSARKRVAHLLLELFVRCRMRWPGHRSEEMHLPLTQEHIADATGLTGVHVNRVLRDLRREGIAEFHYRRLRILNPDRLADVARIGPEAALPWIDVGVSIRPDTAQQSMPVRHRFRRQAAADEARTM
ncbi:MAG: Crp/Fnr family transcriptional regulator [Xanthobacteraceae bacterium]|nr:Crp/Fnr family transcriptional regulator [Xanthobacteraceae bacterium]